MYDNRITKIIDNISIALLLKKSETKFHIIKKNTLMDQKNISKIQYIGLIACYEFKIDHLWILETKKSYNNLIQIQKTISDTIGIYNGKNSQIELKNYYNEIRRYWAFSSLSKYLKDDAHVINRGSPLFQMTEKMLNNLSNLLEKNNHNIDLWYKNLSTELENEIKKINPLLINV